MSLTPQQLADRRLGIGASDVPALFGYGFVNAYDLWLEKTGKLDPAANQENEAMEIGNAIEPTIGILAAKRLAEKVPGFQRLIHSPDTFLHPGGVLRANVDFMLNEARTGAQIVEAKSTGIVEGWGEPGTDEIPERVLLQVHAQFLCAGSDFAYVAQLISRFGFKFNLYEVNCNASICETILETAHDFWTKNVQADVPPDDVPSLDVVKHRVRTPKKTISIPADVALAYSAANDAAKAADAAKDHAKAALIAAMGDAEEATFPGGRYTYFEQSRKETIVKASTFRVLRAAKVK